LIEREVKLSFPNADVARSALLGAGAAAAQARRLQDDSLYDTADESFRKKGCMVRLRTERWPDGARATFITVKGPVQPGPMKMREEHETRIEQGDVLARGFELLGLRPWFRYQKYREEFAATNLVAAIDETPVGVFVELEGSDEAIRAMTAALGKSSDDFILDSYYRLFQNRREQFGLSGPYMLFPPSSLRDSGGTSPA
jgi:adenylate cyclase class 2